MDLASPILVAGAGAWGTALAVHLARNNQQVHLWGHRPSMMRTLCQERSNSYYLPDISFPPSLHVFDNLSLALHRVRDVLVVIPSQAFHIFLTQLQASHSQPLRIAWGTKGLDPLSARPLHELVAQVFGEATAMAIVSGPSFAKEVGQGLPTAICISGNDVPFVRDLTERLHSSNFRVYPNDDFLGVQLCGVMKNVLAIAMGIAVGLDLGANSRAALLTRGIAEMRRLLLAFGGSESTLLGLAGMGDLVLTCSDHQSRNRRFGFAVGQGVSIDEAQASVGGEVEGLPNTRQLLSLADSLGVELPITQQVFEILYEGIMPKDGLQALLSRQRADGEQY